MRRLHTQAIEQVFKPEQLKSSYYNRKTP